MLLIFQAICEFYNWLKSDLTRLFGASFRFRERRAFAEGRDFTCDVRGDGGQKNERVRGADELSVGKRGEISPVAGEGRRDLEGSGLRSD